MVFPYFSMILCSFEEEQKKKAGVQGDFEIFGNRIPNSGERLLSFYVAHVF